MPQLRFASPRQLLCTAKKLYQLLDETVDEYSSDRGELAAAGLAFFTMLSIAPLIIIAVAVAGAVLGQGQAREEALSVVQQTMGPREAAAVSSWVRQASESGALASVIGFVLVLYTASRLAVQLRVALNQVWNVDPQLTEGFKASVRDYLKRRAVAFLFVLASGPMLLLVFASRALLSGLNERLFAETPLAGTLAQLGQLVFSLMAVAITSALVFKLVPDTRIGWRAIWRGAALTSVLFNAGNWLIGLYLGRASVAQAYGAAGALVVVLLWLYFSAQIFLFCAEFTQVYARHYGLGLNEREQSELSEALGKGGQLSGSESTTHERSEFARR